MNGLLRLALAGVCGFLLVCLIGMRLAHFSAPAHPGALLPWLEAFIAAVQICWLLHRLGMGRAHGIMPSQGHAAFSLLLVLLLAIGALVVLIACSVPLLEQAVLIGMTMLTGALERRSAGSANAAHAWSGLGHVSIAIAALMGGVLASVFFPWLDNWVMWTTCMAGMTALLVLPGCVLHLEEASTLQCSKV